MIGPTQSPTLADLRQPTTHIKGMLDEMIDRIRQDAPQVDDPNGKALFETTAEVLLGLKIAYDFYERKQERVFRRQQAARTTRTKR
jgi:hypothetical protein